MRTSIEPADLVRAPGDLHLSGIRANSLESLRRALTVGAGERLVAADLSLGAWQTHHAAIQLAGQLGLELGSSQWRLDESSPPARVPNPSFGDVIGAFIDAEGRGDKPTLAAFEFASLIAASLPRDVSVLVFILPRFGLEWEPEDRLLVQFLARALALTDVRIVLVWADPGEPRLAAGWNVNWTDAAPQDQEPGAEISLLGLVPGVVDPTVREALRPLEPVDPARVLPLPREHYLIPPEFRRDPRTVSRFDYDKLALATRPGGWLHAYAQFHGNNFYVDPWFLWSQAWRELEAGGYGVARRLAERGRECARDPLQRGVLQSLGQGICIAAQQFGQAAESPDPSPGVPKPLRGFLLETKGWALSMLDRPDQAELYFQGARPLLSESGQMDREYLYFLNIWALNRLKLGDWDHALELEKEIESRHTRLPQFDWHLKYINAINLARLYRRRQAFESAEAYYAQAFAATSGARTEGDCLYTNVCQARLDEARHRPADAFAHWMRAALHWVSNSVPEALASRVAAAIVGSKVSPGETDPEQVAAAIESLLISSSSAAGLDTVARAIRDLPEGTASPVFLRAERLPLGDESGAPEFAVLGSGWSVLGASFPAAPPLRTPHYRHLCALLAHIIHLAFPQDLRAYTIVVDDRYGTEMAQTLDEVLELALRWQIPRLVVNGNTWEMGQDARSALETSLQARMGNAIDRVERTETQVSVYFKRYIPYKVLTPQQSEILQALDTPVRIVELKRNAASGLPWKEFLGLLRSMERSRLIHLEIPKDIAGQIIQEAVDGKGQPMDAPVLRIQKEK